nr:hypothetical protein Iba_chr07cCG9020 [Ipomoea batatas]
MPTALQDCKFFNLNNAFLSSSLALDPVGSAGQRNTSLPLNTQRRHLQNPGPELNQEDPISRLDNCFPAGSRALSNARKHFYSISHKSSACRISPFIYPSVKHLFSGCFYECPVLQITIKAGPNQEIPLFWTPCSVFWILSKSSERTLRQRISLMFLPQTCISTFKTFSNFPAMEVLGEFIECKRRACLRESIAGSRVNHSNRLRKASKSTALQECAWFESRSQSLIALYSIRPDSFPFFLQRKAIQFRERDCAEINNLHTFNIQLIAPFAANRMMFLQHGKAWMQASKTDLLLAFRVSIFVFPQPGLLITVL